VIGLGTWQLGGDWGAVTDADGAAVLAASVDAGITVFDTADVYGDGRSERLIGHFLAHDAPGAEITVATKMGRRAEQLPENFVLANFREWTDRSRTNLGMDTLDLVQLHCPPSAVFESGEVYDALDALVDEGVMKNYGVSVETCDQALAAISHPGVATVQIILNSDHRNYNRDGSHFDVGETFSGVDFEVGLQAATEFAALAPAGLTPAQAALAWVAQLDGVSAVIPGARSVAQAQANAAAGVAEPLGVAFNEAVQDIYDRLLRKQVHPRW
jgi:aryl-alcohol dehydrogenase-like predicted oxidoreductase